MDSKRRRSRTLRIVLRRFVVLSLVCVLGVVLTGSAWPFASRGNCGPALCIPTGRGWFGSVGPGVVDWHSAAWVLVGNFWFPADAAGHEGNPAVPPGKVLISMGDFPVVSAFAHWRRVRRLRLPRNSTAKRAVSWHVRFASRAVFLSVSFGSAPSRQTRRLVNAKLLAVHRNRLSDEGLTRRPVPSAPRPSKSPAPGGMGLGGLAGQSANSASPSTAPSAL
jgi:hypothetical protein